MGELLTRWTIRLALACYAAFLAQNLLMRGAEPRQGWIMRWQWTAACVFLWLHLASAFHFYHNWSHASAVLDTARQSQATLGWEFGEGIFFSDAMAVLWLADVIWWWINPRTYLARPRWLSSTVHVYILFIVFNGAIVFESGVTRIAGTACCLILIVGLLLRSNPLASHRDNGAPEQ